MPFLFEIVANDLNGIDVDKYVSTFFCLFAASHLNPRFDYIARDCHAVGEKRNITMTR
jgi:hypothetical protein